MKTTLLKRLQTGMSNLNKAEQTKARQILEQVQKLNRPVKFISQGLTGEKLKRLTKKTNK